MRKINVIFVVSLLLLALVPLTSAEPETVRVFIKFSGNPQADLVVKTGGKVLHTYELLENTIAVEMPAKALSALLKNPNVIGYELDGEVHTAGKPSKCEPWPECRDGGEDPIPDPDPTPTQELPWGVDRIGADLQPADGAGITVCIIDTGVDQDHPDLAANIIGGRNFVPKGVVVNPAKWDDDNGHGTHVAGTVAALDNSEGVVGVAPAASILVVKALDRKGSGYLSDVVAGIDYCVANGADVISMSLGSSSDVQSMHDAADNALAAGVLLVAAAGNDYGGAVGYPAAYGSVIAVSSTEPDDSISAYSNVGPEVELAAPGRNILSTWKGGAYETISGTSMATPHVSGVVALAKQLNPLLTAPELRTLLQSTADDLGALGLDSLYGYGLVDAELI